MSSTAIRVSTDDALSQYMASIKSHPILTMEEEQQLARAFHEDGDVQAAHRLVVSNLRFVVKIAHQYRQYKVHLLDLIQEGNMGLMHAVRKFDPSKGYRLISYAVWWIRASMQSFIQRTWSVVRLGNTRARRKLFFKLRSEQSKAEFEQSAGDQVSSEDLAERLGVDETDVVDMQARLAYRDFSLDAPLFENSEGATSHLDMLVGADYDQERSLGEHEQSTLLLKAVDEVKKTLNDKETVIIDERLLSENPKTLQDIGLDVGVSRERVRQLEKRVVDKLRHAMVQAAAVKAIV